MYKMVIMNYQIIDLKDCFDYFNTLNLNLSSFRVKKRKI